MFCWSLLTLRVLPLSPSSPTHVSRSLATTPNYSSRIKFLARVNMIINWGRVIGEETTMRCKSNQHRDSNANPTKREQQMDITTLMCIRENIMIKRDDKMMHGSNWIL
jgi:hypothetical protein